MWERILAGIVLAAVLLSVLRLALGLRAAKLERERALESERQAGRTVVAELPRADGTVGLFLEDAEAFRWESESMPRRGVQAVRLLLNGAVVAESARAGFDLAPPSGSGDYEGRERWEVRMYGAGDVRSVACGSLREGVSRAAARAVYEAARRAVEEASR